MSDDVKELSPFEVAQAGMCPCCDGTGLVLGGVCAVCDGTMIDPRRKPQPSTPDREEP